MTELQVFNFNQVDVVDSREVAKLLDIRHADLLEKIGGYTRSKTINITCSDGQPDTVLSTEWTQKGRLLIHEILTAHGILAMMDRVA